MDRDNASTATATQADGMTRRGVMRRAVIASGATVGVGAAGSRTGAIGGASAIAPAVGLGAAAGAGALAYLIKEGAENILGGKRNLDGYTGPEALKAAVKESALAMDSADERVMTSIENNLTNSEAVALTKAKAAAVKELNAGNAEPAAVGAVETAINDYYSAIQQNIINHHEAQASQVIAHSDKFDANEDLSTGNLMQFYGQNRDLKYLGPGGDPAIKSKTVTLANGTEKEVTIINGESRDLFGDPTFVNIGWDNGRQIALKYGSVGKYYRPSRMSSAFNAAGSKASDVSSQISGLVSDLYANYGQGDIPTEDFIDPVTAATELEQSTGMASQAANAAMLGIPTSAGLSLRLELTDENGDKFEVEAELYTNAEPTNSGGETGFLVGETYDPANYDEPIYVAYEYIDTDTGEETSDFIQINKPFKVLEAKNSEGQNVTKVETTEKINQTSDISNIEEQLAQIRQEQIRLQDKAEEEKTAGGAGAGFFSGSPSNIGIVALGGAVIALLLGNR